MLFQVYNGAMQTTAAAAKVTTSAAIKTLLQVKPNVLPFKVTEWGISFDGSAAATPGTVELIETDVNATITAYVGNDITRVDADALLIADPTTNIFVTGTAGSGFTATTEGSITTVRNLAAPQLIAPTNEFIQQFPLGQEPVIQLNKFGRIRVTFATAINALCYMKLQV